MALRNIWIYKHSFIVLAAIIIALLNTLPFFSGIFNASDSASNPFRNSGFIITRSLWYLAQTFVTVLVIIYFNYSWIRWITPPKAKMYLKITLKIIYNIALAYGLLWASVLVAGVVVGNPFGIKGALFFYSWKFIYIVPLAILVAYVIKLAVNAKVVEVENYKLKEENLNVQIKSLKDQVNPHFLFNTLNTLSSLIRLGNKDEGLQFVDDLAKVYRYILESEKKEFVSVKYELEILQSYYFMLRKRFGVLLNIHIDIDEEKLNTLVPPMVFQHLVENAIKHNEISSQTPLLIRIYNDDKYIYVRNKIHQKPETNTSLGVGLPNLIKRYKLMADKNVIIQHVDDEFIVKLPVIKS